MTKMVNTYAEAVAFMDRVSDRYEVTIIAVKDGFLVVCER